MCPSNSIQDLQKNDSLNLVSELSFFPDKGDVLNNIEINQFVKINNKNLYNNTIDVFNSSNELNCECYILDKKINIHPGKELKVFATKGIAETKNCWIHPRELPNHYSTDLFLIPFIAGLVIFCTIFIRYGKYFSKYFEGLVYAYAVEKFINDLNIPTKRLLFLLDSISLISLTFISSEILDILGVESLVSIKMFMIIFAALLMYRIYMFFIHKVMEILLENKTIIQTLYFDSLIAIRGGGIILFPLSAIIFFTNNPLSEYILYFAIAVFGILFIYRFIRLIMLFVKNNISFLYFILYLCALEIVPIIILYLEVQKI